MVSDNNSCVLGDHPITGSAELGYNKILPDHRKNQVVNLGDRHWEISVTNTFYGW